MKSNRTTSRLASVRENKLLLAWQQRCQSASRRLVCWLPKVEDAREERERERQLERIGIEAALNIEPNSTQTQTKNPTGMVKSKM